MKNPATSDSSPPLDPAVVSGLLSCSEDSEYFTDLDPWFEKNLGKDFIQYRTRINSILHEESQLMEIVKLIGADVLPDDQKLVIEIARVIRVGFLQQNAFHPDDTFVPLTKQKLMMKVILYLNKKARQLISASIPISRIIELGLFDKLATMKYDIPNDKLEMFDDYIKDIDTSIATLLDPNAAKTGAALPMPAGAKA